MEKETIRNCSTCKYFAQHYMLDNSFGISRVGSWHCRKGIDAKRFRKNCEKYEYGENDVNTDT